MRIASSTAAACLLGLAQADAAGSIASASAALSDRLSSLWGKVAPYVPTTGAASLATTTGGTLAPATTRQITRNLSAANWEEVLGGAAASSASASASSSSSSSSSSWLVVVSGGNTTCGGRCRQLDAAWEVAAAQARTETRAPNLALVDCEVNRLLCATWGAEPGTAWWIEPEVRTPSPDAADAAAAAAKVIRKEAEVEGAAPLQAKVASPVRVSREVYVVPLNTTTVGADDITRLYRKSEYRTRGELLDAESWLSRHPFNGRLARLGLNGYVGYVYFAIGMVPSWTFVMILSVTMRMFLQNKAQKPRETAQQKAERERSAKYTADGKVRGAPPGDGRSHGAI